MLNIKERLLATECFTDNEWLDSYVELISTNKLLEPIKYRSATHHIIPKHVFNYLG